MDDDFIARCEAEQKQLNDRIDKLNAFMGSEKFRSLDETIKYLMTRQHYAMQDYSYALGRRIKHLHASTMPNL